MKNKRSWISLIRTSEQIRSRATSYANGAQTMTVTQINVLSMVYEHSEDGITVKELARGLNVSPGAASQNIEALVELGMLERLPADHDPRVILVKPTAKGIEVCENALERFNFVLDETFSEFNADERQTIARMLKQLVKKMTKVHSSETLSCPEKIK